MPHNRKPTLFDSPRHAKDLIISRLMQISRELDNLDSTYDFNVGADLVRRLSEKVENDNNNIDHDIYKMIDMILKKGIPASLTLTKDVTKYISDLSSVKTKFSSTPIESDKLIASPIDKFNATFEDTKNQINLLWKLSNPKKIEDEIDLVSSVVNLLIQKTNALLWQIYESGKNTQMSKENIHSYNTLKELIKNINELNTLNPRKDELRETFNYISSFALKNSSDEKLLKYMNAIFMSINQDISLIISQNQNEKTLKPKK